MTPFHHKFESPTKEVRYFNSNDLQHWCKFGYQYDTLERKKDESDDKYVARITEYIEKTYPSTGRLCLEDSSKLFGKDHGDTYNDYIIDVLYDR